MKELQNKLAQLLEQKSEELNLFSAQDRTMLMEKHFPDALEFLNAYEGGANMVLDVGTGGGIPGLVLAIEYPEIQFTLLDAREKKIRAVMDVSKELGLENTKGVAERFETLAHDPEYRGQFDVVVARAVAELPVLLEYAVGFLKEDGKLFAWKGPDFDEELASSKNAQEILGFELDKAHKYTLPTGEERNILVFRKIQSAPDKYPRRVGIVKKRPL